MSDKITNLHLKPVTTIVTGMCPVCRVRRVVDEKTARESIKPTCDNVQCEMEYFNMTMVYLRGNE